MNIILDLDGTLLTSHERLYELFVALVGNRKITFDQYWDMKKSKISNEEILSQEFSYPIEKIIKFKSVWMDKIENEHFLNMDKWHPNVIETIYSLAKDNSLYICTARQRVKPVIQILESSKILGILKDVLVTEQKNTKKELIFSSVKNLSQIDWIIGDTGQDINTGKELGIKTCGLTCGFQSLETLRLYQPDFIGESLADFANKCILN